MEVGTVLLSLVILALIYFFVWLYGRKFSVQIATPWTPRWCLAGWVIMEGDKAIACVGPIDHKQVSAIISAHNSTLTIK